MKASILISLCGIFISKFLPINVSIVQWIASLLSLFLITAYFSNVHRYDIMAVGLVSILFQLASMVIFNRHLLDSANSIGTNANLISWLFYVLILSAAATGHYSLDEDGIFEIMQFMLNCASVSAAIVLLMDYSKITAAVSGTFNSYASAFWGFFPNKNMFGMVCALGLLAGVYCIFTPRKSKVTFFKCAFLLVMFLLSFCRSAWLFVAVFLVVFFPQNFNARNRHNRKINRRLFLLFMIGILLCLVVIFSNPALRSKVETTFLRLDVGDTGRTYIQALAWSGFAAEEKIAFLLGVGYSEYSFLNSIDVHNVLLYTFFTGGIPKLIALMVLIVFSFRTNKRCKDALLRHFGTSVLIAFLAISLFETYEPFEVGFGNMMLFIYILLFPMLRGAGSPTLSMARQRDKNEK